jgi:methionyl-tRNA synthetase
VWLHEALEKFPADYLRYGVAKVIPETKDSDFAWDGLQAAVNNELADTLGNFVNRTFTFAKKHFDGRVPALEAPTDFDVETLAALKAFPERIGGLMERHRFREAVDETMALARLGNKYFNDSQPWATRKTDLKQCGNTIHVALQLCASLAILFEPVIPTSAVKLREMLKMTSVLSSEPNAADAPIAWDEAGQPLLEAGHELGEAEILFTKLKDEVIQAEIDTLVQRSTGPDAESGDDSMDIDADAPYAPMSDTIQFDDFTKLDLRVGKVLVAEPVPKSKKLLRTEVDLGFETRQVLAGVAQHIKPEDLVGKRVVVVANLAPRKIFGLESQGMLLMAEDRNGRLIPIDGAGEPGATVS